MVTAGVLDMEGMKQTAASLALDGPRAKQDESNWVARNTSIPWRRGLLESTLAVRPPPTAQYCTRRLLVAALCVQEVEGA